MSPVPTSMSLLSIRSLRLNTFLSGFVASVVFTAAASAQAAGRFALRLVRAKGHKLCGISKTEYRPLTPVGVDFRTLVTRNLQEIL